jgi:cold shock CspA family protein
MQGTMLWFNETKDFGFISTDDGERLIVHGAGFAGGKRPEGRCAGTPVTFRISENGETREATEVAVVSEDSPRRARMRAAGRRKF